MKKIKDQKITELAFIMKDLPAEKIRSALVKSEGIFIRCTEADKAAIIAAAKKYHLTVTDYLISLHKLAEGK